MPRTRKSSSSPFDLLSFQDVITSTTGIMLILTLLLVLTISADRILTAETSKAQAKFEQQAHAARIAELESELEQRSMLAAEKARQMQSLAQYVRSEIVALEKQATEIASQSAVPTQTTRKLQLPENSAIKRPVLVILRNNTAYMQWEGKEIKIPYTEYPHFNWEFLLPYLEPAWADFKFMGAEGRPPFPRHVHNPADAAIFLIKPSAFGEVADNFRPPAYFP